VKFENAEHAEKAINKTIYNSRGKKIDVRYDRK
jgi:hypothetical protein